MKSYPFNRRKWLRPLPLLPLLLLMNLILGGCSEMKFLDRNASNVSKADDPRNDIRLTNIETDLTSAGVTIQRVHGAEAIYAPSRSILLVEDMRIDTFDTSSGLLQGQTRAETGTLYLANAPEAARGRNDMEFLGGVEYRSPQRSNPTSDSLRLQTERLVYEKDNERFISPSTNTITMAAPGKTPMTMKGTTLTASQDLSNISIQGGRMGLLNDADAKASYTRTLEEMNAVGKRAAEQLKNPPARPTPIVVEPTSAPPQRGTPIPVQPTVRPPQRGTPIPVERTPLPPTPAGTINIGPTKAPPTPAPSPDVPRLAPNPGRSR